MRDLYYHSEKIKDWEKVSVESECFGMVKQKEKLKDPKFANELLTIIADEQEHVYPQETNTDLRDEVSKKLDLI